MWVQIKNETTLNLIQTQDLGLVLRATVCEDYLSITNAKMSILEISTSQDLNVRTTSVITIPLRHIFPWLMSASRSNSRALILISY
ncbi:hypothetical protein LA080_010786 [Diaporthe eres]|nr:hypothetical protein LA080_010786 [Diaporthe eres]